MPLESYHLGNCLFIQPNNVIDLDVLIQKSGVGEEFPLSAREPCSFHRSDVTGEGRGCLGWEQRAT